MNRIPIDSVEDFEMVCDDMLSDFLDSFREEQGLLRMATQDEMDEMEYRFDDDENPPLVYTDKAEKLYKRYRNRLQKIADREWGDADIKSSQVANFW